MSEELGSNATETVDPALALEILDRVDAFYNNAWLKLLVIGSLLLVVIGFLGPLLVQWYQRRFFRLEEQKLRDELSEESKTEIKRLFEDESRKIEERFEENALVFARKTRWLAAVMFLNQGHMARTSTGHAAALQSYLLGILDAVDSTDESMVQRLIECALRMLGRVTRVDLDDTSSWDLREKIREVIEKLEEHNEGRRYAIPLDKINEALKQAEQRQPDDSLFSK